MRGENKHITNFDGIIIEVANRLNKEITSVTTGFVESGSDFRSYNVSLIKTKNVAALEGDGTSSLSFREIWHFFETQLNFLLNVINTKNLDRVNLSKYQVLILPIGYKANEKKS